MQFTIHQEVRSSIAGISVVLLPISHVTVVSDSGIHSNVVEKNTATLDEVFFKQPLFDAYRKFYQKLGFDTSKKLPSVESLYRRFQKDGSFPNINTIVNTVNEVALSTLIPLGVFDQSKVKRSIELRYSTEDEQFFPIGSSGSEVMKNRMVVMADDEKVLSQFFHRDSEYIKITPETKDILVLGCKVEGVDLDMVKQAVIRASELIVERAGGSSGELESID